MKTLDLSARVGLKSKNQAEVLEAHFGDGYTQRVPQGIQNIETELSLTFELSREKTHILLTFLEEHKGANAFLWKNPLNDSLERFICKDWQVQAISWDTRTVICQFIRVHA